MRLSMEIRSFQRIQGKVRSVGCALIQYDGTLIKKGEIWSRRLVYRGDNGRVHSKKVARWLE